MEDGHELMMQIVADLGPLKMGELIAAADEAIARGRRGITWGGDHAVDRWAITVSRDRVSFRRVGGTMYSLPRDWVVDRLSPPN